MNDRLTENRPSAPGWYWVCREGHQTIPVYITKINDSSLTKWTHFCPMSTPKDALIEPVTLDGTLYDTDAKDHNYKTGKAAVHIMGCGEDFQRWSEIKDKFLGRDVRVTVELLGQ